MMMTGEFLKVNLGLIAMAASLIIFKGGYTWVLGFVMGAVWSLMNFLLIFHSLNIFMLQRDRKKLPLILLLKFPVLYICGYVILALKIFPPMSFLLGFTLVLFSAGVLTACPRRT